MSYAIRNDGRGWRAVSGPDDLLPDETLADAPPGSIADAQAWAAHQGAAHAALAASDRVVIRCAEAGVPVPADWRAYRAALRAIVAAAAGDPAAPLPAAPDYPAGT